LTTFLWLISWVLTAAHATAPAAALALVFLPGSPLSKREKWSLAVAFVVGAVSGLLVATIYVRVLFDPTQTPDAWELFKAAWLGASLLLVLRWFDDGVRFVLRRVDRKMRRKDTHKRRWGKSQIVGLALVRVAMLFCVVMPYAMAAVLTYRPRFTPPVTPSSALKLDFESFSALTQDSKLVAGWFIPAPGRSSHTVILCHGQGLGKVEGLSITGFLHEANLNVVLFDFRGYGQSDGVRSSLGFAEPDDIRAVLEYLRNQKAQESQSIFAIGTDTGAAALVNLLRQTPNTPIKAVALVKPYLSLEQISQDVSQQAIGWPLKRVLPWVTLRFAAAQTGFPLYESPKMLDLWPTPVLVLHDLQVGYVHVNRSMEFFEALSPPKRSSWRYETDPREMFFNSIQSILLFFEDAKETGPVV
jgi:pimeloyl-ACP methyl ester carboxylesterase